MKEDKRNKLLKRIIGTDKKYCDTLFTQRTGRKIC